MNLLEKHSYTAEQRAAAISHILTAVAGGKSVALAIREARAAGIVVPSKSVFWMWHYSDITLQDQLARARLNGVEAKVEEALDILDGTDLERDENGQLKNPEEAFLMDTQRAKARAQIRIDYARMIAPRKYGPKLDVTSDGEKLHDAKADTAGAVIDVLSAVAKRVEGRETRDTPALPSTLDDLLS